MIRKRRTASVNRQEVSRPVAAETRKKRVSSAVAGIEPQRESGAQSEEQEEERRRRAEDKRHACVLLHYSQN